MLHRAFASRCIFHITPFITSWHSNTGVINEAIISRRMESGLGNCRFIEDMKLQSPLLHVRALEALADPDCGWFYWADADGSRAIPGSRGR